MNDVRLHVPYIFGNKQNSKYIYRENRRGERDSTDTEEGTTEERPAVGQDKLQRGKAKAR